MSKQRIYVASSWRNARQPAVVQALREAGHLVYDFRNPKIGDQGFSWSEIEPDWENWSPETYRKALSHPVAKRGFKNDYDAMLWASVFVLVLPCGRSAHLEAGWAMGARKPVLTLMEERCEPELMYKLAEPWGGSICLTLAELLGNLGRL